MTRPHTSAQDRLKNLSTEKTELIKLLIDEKARRKQQIKPHPRRNDSRLRLPASWSQQRLWFIDQMEGNSSGYRITVTARLLGVMDYEALQRALDHIVDRHETLRTVFVNVDGEPQQEILASGRFRLEIIHLAEHSSAEREAQVRQHKLEEACTAFDLSTGPLIRGRLLCLLPHEHVLLVTMHHIVSDGWSKSIFVRELAQLYAAYRDGKAPKLDPLPIQFGDYALWQREWLTGREFEQQRDYWRKCLGGVAPELSLPSDRARPAVPSHRGGNVAFVLDAELSTKLRQFAKRYEMTLFMVLYAGWAILLSRLSAQTDIAVGTPVANRSRSEVEGLIGFFANTLVLRSNVVGEMDLGTFLQQVKEMTLGAFSHQDMPFEQIVETLQPERSLNRNPIFQVMLVLLNTPAASLNLPGLTVIEENDEYESSPLDLVVVLQERGQEITGHLNYSADLFDQETCECWMESFRVLLEGMVNGVFGRVGELPILSEAQCRRVIDTFNATQASYPREASLHHLFEAQVERCPDAVALICDGQSLTYAELNSRANQLARHFRNQGVRVGDYVPVLMSRSAQMVIAQIAVLKSGGVYVPIDPDLPTERLAFMIRDCGARCIVADRAHNPGIVDNCVRWIDCLAAADAIQCESETNLESDHGVLPPAYVMFTSGSTGTPKGVIVPHHAVSRLAINNGYAEIGPEDCLTHYSNPAFDASTFEVWGALLNGAKLLVLPGSIPLEPNRFAAALRDHGVTVLWITVGLFNQYAEELADVFRGLRYVITGGDSLDPATIRRVLRSSPPQHLLNAYGPTECTTFSTTHYIEAVAEDAKTIPIGRPISNARIYILDERRQVVPIGVAGELYIGGAGVACGYLNRPELTAQRFLPDPFSQSPNARMYKTGDLGRWRADGVIEFLGRNDRQVKIRGFRIELEEVEAQIARHVPIQQVIVIAREENPNDKRLIAYLVPRPDAGPIDVQGLRARLKTALPEYMLPSAFICLEQLPLTVNGKVDLRSLPAPEGDAYRAREYEAPRGQIEEVVAGIWQELLRVERVGRHDHFFDLGGHSLLATRLLARIRDRLEVEVSLRALFESPTVAEFAERIVAERAERARTDAFSAEAMAQELRRKIGAMPDDAVLARIAELERELGCERKG